MSLVGFENISKIMKKNAISLRSFSENSCFIDLLPIETAFKASQNIVLPVKIERKFNFAPKSILTLSCILFMSKDNHNQSLYKVITKFDILNSYGL